MPRGRIIFLAIAFVVGGFLFFCAGQVLAAPQDVQITEIMYNPSNTDTKHEWVELYNNGSEEIEIVGGSKTGSWRFCDENDDKNCNHWFSTSTILLPGEFMIVAQSTSTFSDEHTGFTGKLVQSSFNDLNNIQDTVALRIGTDGDLWSKVDYLNSWGGDDDTGKSLEKKNLAGDNSAANWQESATEGGTPGATNSTGASPSPPSPTPPAAPEISSPDISPAPAAASFSCQNTILVNEITINPEDSNADYEFVELYNQTDMEKDISGWILEDSQGKTAKFTLPANTRIASHAFLTFYRPQTKITLNNSGDGIKLSNASGQICDASPHNSGAADEDMSYSRKNANWVWTSTATPNAANVFTEAKSNSADSSNQKNNESPSSISTPIPTTASSTIILNEFMPNPKGIDTEKEFIELKNISAVAVKLDKWRLEDSSRKKFVFSSSTIINANGFLTIWGNDSNISLNNNDDVIKLFNPDGQIVDQISYNEPAEDNFSYNRVSVSSTLWKWSTVPSPGVENFISEPNHPPTIIFSVPNVAEIGEEIFFDASNSTDPEEDNLSFVWNFGDKTEAIGATSTHQYARAGQFKITLTANDYHANEVKEKAVMTIIDNGETLENDSATAGNVKQSKSTAKWLNVSGAVTVPPGLFGTQYFYLQDNSGRGWQIYMFKKDFPDLKVGDRVQTAGETSEMQNGVRVKTKKKEDIIVLSGREEAAPEELAIADIDDAGLGGLIKITGEVLEPKSGKFYLADDSGEILVELKSRAGFKGQIVKEGDIVEVTGILAASTGAYKIWPRFASDIKILESKKETGGATSDNAPTNNFLSATAGGLGSLLLAYVARGRAALAKGLAMAAISKIAFWRKNNKNLT